MGLVIGSHLGLARLILESVRAQMVPRFLLLHALEAAILSKEVT